MRRERILYVAFLQFMPKPLEGQREGKLLLVNDVAVDLRYVLFSIRNGQSGGKHPQFYVYRATRQNVAAQEMEGK